MESTIRADVEAINRLREEAFETGDIWDFIDYFTDDAVWMPSGGATLEGKDAVRAWATRYDGKTYRFEIVPQQVVVAGDWAFDRFIEIMIPVSSSGDERTPYTFQSFWTLRRQEDNSWKVAHWIWNEHPPV